MSAKKWFGSLLVSIGLIAALIAVFNFICDPFGVFGDSFFQKHSFNMTNNPKAAKLRYIDSRYGDYDAYVIGASGSSSLSVAKLNEYTGLSWYNMFNYGADMAYTRELAGYLIENYEVRHILLNLTLSSAAQYGLSTPEATDKYPPQIAGALTYLDFLFANPRYSLEKLKNITLDTYLPQKFDVFVPETGSYDKSLRDIERIGDMDEYLENYPEFSYDYGYKSELIYIDECISALAEIKELCSANGIELTVVIPPMWTRQLSGYDKNEVAVFFKRLAEITSYIDFSFSSISEDVRYFYDATHFRNSVGDMMLARVFGDGDIYVPDGFGVFIDETNVGGVARELWKEATAEEYTTDVPILIYHHITENPSGAMEISPARFEEQIKVLTEEGYTGVGFDELIAYVERGGSLPEKTVCISFDDGYLSNYELAFPILKKYGMKATIFVIGVTVGEKELYKDTGYRITPHFDFDEAREMIASGLISIQSHTYDMHQSAEYEGIGARESVLRFEDEPEKDYIEALRLDCDEMSRLFIEELGYRPSALAYPRGMYDGLSAAILREMGINVTLSVKEGVAELVRGLPQSLLAMPRICPYETTGAGELLYLVTAG